jgi:proline iminopeptidase
MQKLTHSPDPTASMTHKLYPAIEPFHTGLLETADKAHQIYFEECGNPDGTAVVVLHGGPGSGCNPGQRRFFDPESYRIVLFDQRGCGRSQPAGKTEFNNTTLLAQDIELLRQHLGITTWMVFGGSWGSTLALCYAAAFPGSITRLILRGIFLARPHELNWFLYEIRLFFPEAWERFTRILDGSERQDVLHAYASRIFNAPHIEQVLAAKTWSEYESRIMTLLPPPPPAEAAPEDSMLSRLKVHLHYLSNGCFLEDAPVLSRIDRFRHIPTTIVHGRYDMVCPIRTAHELHCAWPESEFIVVDEAGHSAMEPGIISTLVSITNRYR